MIGVLSTILGNCAAWVSLMRNWVVSGKEGFGAQCMCRAQPQSHCAYYVCVSLYNALCALDSRLFMKSSGWYFCGLLSWMYA